MDKFNLTNFISKFTYKSMNVAKAQMTGAQNQPASTPTPSPQTTQPAVSQDTKNLVTPQMGSLAGTETSAYVKDLLKLPKNLNEFVYMVQRGLNQMQMSRMLSQQIMAQKSNMISSSQAQILAQLQGLSTSELQSILKLQLNANNNENMLRNLQILAGEKLNIAELSSLLQANGKDALTKLILTMSNAAKQGVGDLTQLKDTAKLINASIALASQDNASQTLKTILLLYLPWLPLQEGIDFELEVLRNPDNEESDSILVITISTINFGRVVATLVLETSNSVHVNIECSKEFPKDELSLRIQGEEKHYSLQSVLSFQPLEVKSEEKEHAKANVSMSSMTEINPFLLLMAHAIIRHTIMIDNEASNGIITHRD